MTRKCRLCSDDHEIFYQQMINGRHHLAMMCGRHITYIPFEPNLSIKTILSINAAEKLYDDEHEHVSLLDVFKQFQQKQK